MKKKKKKKGKKVNVALKQQVKLHLIRSLPKTVSYKLNSLFAENNPSTAT